MKGLILAAGRGSRLDELTLEKPKCFIKISKKPLIEYQIEAMRKSGIKSIAVVTGYLNAYFDDLKIKKFHNLSWKSTNMIYSLLCAKEWFETDVIVSYADIIYPSNMVSKLITCKGNFVVAADLNWKDLWLKRFENPFDDAETLKMNDGFLTEIGKKTETYQDIQAQFIGLLKISPNGLGIISEMMKKKIINKQSDFTSTIQKILEKSYSVKVELFKEKWFEIDNQKDIKIAENFFNKISE